MKKQPDDDELRDVMLKQIRKSRDLAHDISHFDRIEDETDPVYTYAWLRTRIDNDIERSEVAENEAMLDEKFDGKRSANAMPFTKKPGICFELKNKGKCEKKGCGFDHDFDVNDYKPSKKGKGKGKGKRSDSRGRSGSSRSDRFGSGSDRRDSSRSRSPSRDKGKGKRSNSPSARKNNVDSNGICKFFLQGNCKFGSKCKNDHSISLPALAAAAGYKKSSKDKKSKSHSKSRDRSSSRDRGRSSDRGRKKDKKHRSSSSSRRSSSSKSSRNDSSRGRSSSRSKSSKKEKSSKSSKSKDRKGGGKKRTVAASPATPARDTDGESNIEIQTDSDASGIHMPLDPH